MRLQHSGLRLIADGGKKKSLSPAAKVRPTARPLFIPGHACTFAQARQQAGAAPPPPKPSLHFPSIPQPHWNASKVSIREGKRWGRDCCPRDTVGLSLDSAALSGVSTGKPSYKICPATTALFPLSLSQMKQAAFKANLKGWGGCWMSCAQTEHDLWSGSSTLEPSLVKIKMQGNLHLEIFLYALRRIRCYFTTHNIFVHKVAIKNANMPLPFEMAQSGLQPPRFVLALCSIVLVRKFRRVCSSECKLNTVCCCSCSNLACMTSIEHKAALFRIKP